MNTNNKISIQDLIDQMPVGVILIDRNYKILRWNQLLTQWTGKTSKDTVGNDIRELYPQIADEYFQSRIALVLEGGPPVLFSAQFHNFFVPAMVANQKIRLQNTTVAQIVVEETGEALALITIQDVSDMSKQIQTMHQLKEKAVHEKNTAQQYLDIAGVMILELDKEGKILVLNQKGCEIMGVQENEVTGCDWFEEFVDPAQREEIRTAFQSFLLDGNRDIHTYQHKVKVRDGSIKTIAWRVQSVQDEKGAPAGTISSGEDVSDKQTIMELLIKKSITDPLTGLYNRSYFFETAENEISYAVRQKKDFVLALLDIDHFKLINDMYGHQAGDAALRQFAQVIRNSVRDYDIAARYGGEEFILFFKDTDMIQALTILERIKEEVAITKLEFGKFAFSITFSGGAASSIEFMNDPLYTIDDFIQIADQRLYYSKESGRNRITGGGDPEMK